LGTSNEQQVRYTDLAIETSQTLRIIYNKGLRQTEGFMLSLVQMMQLNITIPDHTTMSRRYTNLAVINKVTPPGPNEKMVVILDSTGLKVVGEKEWMHCKHGTKQRKMWRKLHLCIDANGKILSSTLTFHTISDPSQVDELLQGVDGPIDTFMGDGGYDSPGVYSALDKHQERHKQKHPIHAVIPPNIGFQAEKNTDPAQRLNNIHLIEDKGKLGWQTETDYGRRARVEN